MKNKVSQNKTVIQSIIGSFVVKGGSLGISVILLPLYLKFFKNQEALGIWFTILSVLNWVILFDLGLGQGLRNQLPIALSANDKKTAKEYISTTYILMICVDIIITIIGLIIIPNLNLNSIFNVDQNILSHQDLVNSVNIVFVGIMIQIVLKIVTSILYALQKSAVVNALALITNVLILTALFVVPSHGIAENLVTMSWIHVIAANLPYVVCTCYIFSKELKGAKPSLNSFSRKYINSILNVGMSLLWLQIVFMIVSSTNEILISNLTEPKDVVEYQAYYKVFKTAAIVVSLALTPIWS